MRRWCYRPIGLYLAAAGLIILFAIIFPAVVWWIALGLALVFAGVMLMRR